MKLQDIPDIINRKSSMYQNFAYLFTVTDTVNNKSKNVEVHTTSLVVAEDALRHLIHHGFTFNTQEK